jgi:hypothetical protein
MSSKGSTFAKALGGILKGAWKLLLLLIYGTARIIEILAGFIGKVTEKFIH